MTIINLDLVHVSMLLKYHSSEIIRMARTVCYHCHLSIAYTFVQTRELQIMNFSDCKEIQNFSEVCTAMQQQYKMHLYVQNCCRVCVYLCVSAMSTCVCVYFCVSAMS